MPEPVICFCCIWGLADRCQVCLPGVTITWASDTATPFGSEVCPCCTRPLHHAGDDSSRLALAQVGSAAEMQADHLAIVAEEHPEDVRLRAMGPQIAPRMGI